MELIADVWNFLKTVVIETTAVVVAHPIAFAVIMTLVLGAAAVAAYLDDANRKLDDLIDEALDTDKEADQS